MNEFYNIYVLRLPENLDYYVKCSRDGNVKTTWRVSANPLTREGSNKWVFLLRLLVFLRGERDE